MTKKPRGEAMLGKIGNNAKLWPYNEPGKKIVMLPVRTLSEMPHCVVTKMQLSGRLCKVGAGVDVYAEMIRPIDYRYVKKKFREENKEVIEKAEKVNIKPVKGKSDKERERIKAFYVRPVSPKATKAFYMNGFTHKRKEQTPHIMADGWRR